MVTLGRPGRHVAAGLATRKYALIASGGSERAGSGMFRPRWWETGCRDEIWMGQDTLIWAAPNLCTSHAALTTPDQPFAELLWTAQAEYPSTTPLGRSIFCEFFALASLSQTDRFGLGCGVSRVDSGD